MNMLSLKSGIQRNLPNWNGKLLAHVMGWFGEPGKIHRVSRYDSSSMAVVANQLDIMQLLGIDGIIVTWQGPTVNPFLHKATIELWEGALARNMLFALCLDPWIAHNQPDPTGATLKALSDPLAQLMLNSSAYLPEQYLLEFDLANSAGVNIAKLQSGLLAPVLSWHSGYSWPNATVNPAFPSDSLNTLKKDNASLGMKVAGVNLCFNDGGAPIFSTPSAGQAPATTVQQAFKGQRDYNSSVWGASTGAASVIDHQAGNWYLDQLATIQPTTPYIAIVTWNDSDEGTGIEHFASMLTGIRIGK